MTNIAVFNNGSFVDTALNTSGESLNVQEAFSSFGFTVSAFDAADDVGVAAALTGQDVLAVPEFERGRWAPDAATVTVLTEFVAAGGGLIKFGFSGQNARFLNDVFGYSVVEQSSGSSTITDAALGTAFDGGPGTLPNANGTESLRLTSLPDEAVVYYATSSSGTVVQIPFGAGTVTYIGWDWFDGAPNGSQDGGWLDVLERAVLQGGQGGIAIGDLFSTDDETVVTGNVLDDNGGGPDDATNGPLTITEVQGEAANVGVPITLASGAVVTLEASGALTYTPSQDLPDGDVLRDRVSYAVEDSIGETGTAVASFTVTGLDNDDVVTGSASSDELAGGLGNDQVFGLESGDILNGGPGDDLLDGGEGADLADYLTAAAAVTVDLSLEGVAQDTIGDGIDTLVSLENLRGSAFDDTLTGSAIANDIDGGAGADVMTGGAGDDTYRVDDPGDVIVELAGEGDDRVVTSVDFTLPAEVEDILVSGSAGAAITGNDGANRLTGSDGDDALRGGLGADILFGSVGADVMDGGDGYDRVDLARSFGAVTIDLTLGTGMGAHAEGDSYVDIEEVRASNYDDTLIGGEAAEQFRGRVGDDSLFGAGGDDILLGGIGGDVMRGDAGEDRLYGQRGDDTMFGGDGVDRLRGNSGDDTMSGGNGDDDLRGGTGDDTLLGGNGADFFMGQFGFDVIFGEDGNDFVRGGGLGDFIDGGADDDILYGQNGDDEIDGGTGIDKVRGNDGDDILRGGADNDDVRGGIGDDILSGDAGDDFLVGGAGADQLFGGAGSDKMIGGADADVFIFRDAASGGGGFDRIKDWEDGVDVIDLTAFGFTDFATDVLSIIGDRADGLRINFGSGDVLFVEGFLSADFDASDVIL